MNVVYEEGLGQLVSGVVSTLMMVLMKTAATQATLGFCSVGEKANSK